MTNINQQLAALQQENERLNNLLQQFLATSRSMTQRPADGGEGPDPSIASSSSLSVEPQAQFFAVAKDDAIDMERLNDGSSTYIQHFAAIKPILREHMRQLLHSMGSYMIYINYRCEMTRPESVRSFLFLLKLMVVGL
jgi:hypothetical protein